MKTIGKSMIFTALAGVMMLGACSVNDDIDERENQPVKFSSGVSGLQTRVGGADGDQWDGTESIGIYMVANGSTTVAENAGNIEHTAQSAGASTGFTSATPVYYPVTTPAKVDFIAYHPYTASVSGYVYPVNVATQISQSAIDLMVAAADNSGTGYDKNNTAAVNLIFAHQLAKVALNVTAGDGMTDLSGLAVSIKGMNTTANFNIAAQTLSNEGAPAAITPYGAGSYNYEALLLPVAALGAGHVVEFTVGGNTYTWTMSDNTAVPVITSLAAGNKYTFNVTVYKNGVSVSGTINAWGHGGNGLGIAL